MTSRRLCAAVATVAVALTPASATLATATAAPVKKLHSGEFCAKRKQGYYKRHGYVCRRASDGRNRLFKR